MATYGLTNSGFVPKTLDVIREELNTALRAAFGVSIDLGEESILGQLVGIIAERFALLWEVAESANASQDVDQATGSGLEALSLLTGTVKPPATYSAVTLTLTGTPTTVVSSGSKAKTASTSKSFAITANATIATLTAWAISTVYAVGDRRTANSKAYQCITSGTSAGSGTGPSTTSADITDGTVHWEYLGEGTGAIDAAALATVTGPITAVARDITSIETPVGGWSSVINVLDATAGRDIATDSELRLLREFELATGGSTPINALRAELLNLADVVAVTIFVNNTDITDVDGIPPHSVEALVRGPDAPTVAFDQAIFDALLAGVAAGIRTHGSGAGLVSGFATDDQGTSHVMKFTRPTEIPIYVVVSVTKDPDEYPTDGDAQIKAAIVAYGDLQNTGKDVVSSRITAAVFDVPGVLDVTTCFIGTAPAPGTSTTIAISLRELAVYDSSRVTVVSVDGVP